MNTIHFDNANKMQRIMNIGARLARIMKTFYLFGKSDIPDVFLSSVRIHNRLNSLNLTEQTAVALILAGPSSFRLMLKAFVWIQLHLLTFQVLP